ncbi:uncharacterized protein TRIVIDRAFT_200173 [Trichoderma virens Gv29-8]|uniref:Uncharacterized protein n=1 Tax=Hypocrea virens (strain Gv29-8 / FGSC 10586) TaxID=413071 RepID=G9MPP1_HYPVG|nr:uncharacterized protein TRIVIDRAFT_200173 [Trichoderma virens Gv29-8]EHK23842.1 hypothetical protein TRIVIDRAFT_200173 [Trichoderma virens Gv29-8]UKZ50147.1 hypothetical protein TrVGV298_004403 [Trichoderma virens]
MEEDICFPAPSSILSAVRSDLSRHANGKLNGIQKSMPLPLATLNRYLPRTRYAAQAQTTRRGKQRCILWPAGSDKEATAEQTRDYCRCSPLPAVATQYLLLTTDPYKWNGDAFGTVEVLVSAQARCLRYREKGGRDEKRKTDRETDRDVVIEHLRL